jgi:CheY-like chemotaxis protein/HPt (histidine-containing phosphotransfer) domain-containing protein
VVGSGKEALAVFDREEFDLVLMDVQMPEMDGFAATAAIRAREQQRGTHVPIIAMTAYAMKGDRERCLEAGMDGYIPKPVRARELYQMIEDLAPPPAAWEREPDPMADPTNGLDWSAALEYVGGDYNLLAELVQLSLAECPRWLAALRRAIAERNIMEAVRMAHNLKGAMKHFGARDAWETAERLEDRTRQGDLSSADETCDELERAIKRVEPALTRVPRAGPG